MKIKDKIKNNKTFLSVCFSIISTIIFAIYNCYLGVCFKDLFAIAISIYYFLLICIKLSALIVEKQFVKKQDKMKSIIRIKTYKTLSIFVFGIDLCLIAPIILMVVKPKDVKFGIIPAITIATYTTYKIIHALLNYKKSKKTHNLIMILLRELNIIEAIVSILTLQHTLIMVNGGMNESMKTLSLITSIGFIVVIIMFSIISFVKNRNISFK